MSEYSSLKATIDANIKANNNQEITGSIMNSVLNEMVNSLGEGYQFMGVATPTNPGSAQTPDYKCFYLATTPGTYTNLGGLVVADGEVALLKYGTSWTKEVTGIASNEKLTELDQATDVLKAELEGGNATRIKTINTQDITSKITYNTSISFPVKQGVTYRIYCKSQAPLLQTNLKVFFRTPTSDLAISTNGLYSSVDLSNGAYVDIIANTTTENAVLRLSYSGGAVVEGVVLSFEIEEREYFESDGLINEAIQPIGNLAQLGYTSLEMCNRIGYYFIPASWVNNVSELSQIDKSVSGSQNMYFINYRVGNNKMGYLFSAIGEMFVYANGTIRKVIVDSYKDPNAGMLYGLKPNSGLSQKAAVKFVQDSLFSNPNDVFTYKDSGTGNKSIYIPKDIKQGDIISYKNIACVGGNTLGFAYRINGSNTFFASGVQIGESGFFTMPVDADGIYVYLSATGESSLEIGLIVIQQDSLYWKILNGALSGFVTCNQSSLQVGVGTPAQNLPGACISVGCNNLTRATGLKNITIGNDNMEDASGDENVTVGFHAGFRNTEGAHNTFIGSEAGDDNTSGKQNVSIGSHALQRNNKGHANVALGYRALLGGFMDYASGGGNRETGYNVAIGYDAAQQLVGGYTNVAIGAEAMKLQTASINNVAIGAGALSGQTQVSRCVAIGTEAGKQADGDNQLWVANSDVDKEHALIFGLFSPSDLANALLRLNAGKILMPNLPTSDPGISGQLWNDNGTLKISI